MVKKVGRKRGVKASKIYRLTELIRDITYNLQFELIQGGSVYDKGWSNGPYSFIEAYNKR